MDVVTLLRVAPGCRATKLWRSVDGTPVCEEYDVGFRVDVGVQPVDSLDSLAALLTSLRARPDLCIVRGQPHQAPASRVLRRSRGDGAFFVEAPRYWVLVDVDSIDVPGFTADPANAAALVRELLPPEFRCASCYWHASASAGFKPGARLHLWFWLTRPARSEEWRAWVRGWPVKVDASVYRTVQPHYTADPILLQLDDPMPARSGILPGEPAVDLSTFSGDNANLRALAEKALSTAVWHVQRADEGDRNTTLYKQACKVAEYAPQLGEEKARRALLEASPLGIAEATATIESAFRATEPRCASSSGWALHLTPLPNARWAPTAANMLDVLELHPELDGALAVNLRTRDPLWLRPPPWRTTAGPLTDGDGAGAARWLDRHARFQGSTPTAALSMLLAVAEKQQIDPWRDYLETLEWDSESRIERWLIDGAGAPDDVYTRAVSKRWLISAVARSFAPGCKADCALILCGEQGRGKSTLLKLLAGEEHFAELQTKLGSDDAYLQLQGPVIVELPELTAMARRDVEQVKADMSTTHDRRRPKYGRVLETRPRRCVYAGTSNEIEILQDATGGRRFWPVQIDWVQLDWIRANRDQLWAEAVAMYRAGERWHLTADEETLAAGVQEERRHIDALEEALADLLRTPQPAVGAIVDKADMDEKGRIIRIRQRQVIEPLQARFTDLGVGKRLASAFRALKWIYRRDMHERWYEAPEGWHR